MPVGYIRSDLLLGDIELSRGVGLIGALANAEDLVVARGTVVVTHLTGTGNGPLDVVRMPSTNTGNLTETLVSLARKLGGTPTAGDTLETVTLGDGNDIDHLVLLEDGVDLDGLLEEVAGEVNLVGNSTTVDLDFHKVGLLLLERSLADLGVGEHTDDSAVLLDALKVAGDGSTALLGVLLGVLGESLLLALVPVLVEATLDLVTQVLSPDGSERAETTGSLDVTDNTNSNELKKKSRNRSVPNHVRIQNYSGEHTGGVSTTVAASTTSFLCILAPGRSRSRTMVVIPAL